MMESQSDSDRDDGRRGPAAISVSLRDEGAGRIRVIVDDLQLLAPEPYPAWKTSCFVTWKTVDLQELRSMQFSDEEALGLGQAILARLSALLATRGT